MSVFFRLATMLFALGGLATLTACANGDTFMKLDADAIRLAKAVPGVEKIEQRPGNFDWQVIMWCTKDDKCPHATGHEDPSTIDRPFLRAIFFSRETTCCHPVGARSKSVTIQYRGMG